MHVHGLGQQLASPYYTNYYIQTRTVAISQTMRIHNYKALTSDIASALNT